MKRLADVTRRPWRDLVAVAEAAVLLGGCRLAIVLLPSRYLQRLFGELGRETTTEALSADVRIVVERVRWSVVGVSSRTPWTSNCLPQALAAKLMLRRRGVPSTLFVGAAFHGRNGLRAHAWLRAGPMSVTGGRAEHNAQRFGAVAAYS